MTSANRCALIADIGGTNARFALVDDTGVHQVQYFKCRDFVSLTDAAQTYLAIVKPKILPTVGVFSIAGPVEGDVVNFTNIPWSFKTSQVKKDLDFERLSVINDFAAVAYAIPGIEDSLVQKIGGDDRIEGRPIGILGPGTGLGVASLIWGSDGYVAIPGEGGHVTMPATNPREMAIFEQLHVKYHHISAERVCSGKGLENLYDAIRVLDGVVHQTEDLDAAGISAKALSHECKVCVEALDLMFAFLGRVAGNLALTLNAKGGIYIAGGIPTKLGDYMQRSRMMSEFTHKGRMSDLAQSYPVYMVMHDSLGMLGLEKLARKELGL